MWGLQFCSQTNGDLNRSSLVNGSSIIGDSRVAARGGGGDFNQSIGGVSSTTFVEAFEWGWKHVSVLQSSHCWKDTCVNHVNLVLTLPSIFEVQGFGQVPGCFLG